MAGAACARSVRAVQRFDLDVGGGHLTKLFLEAAAPAPLLGEIDVDQAEELV